jgi:hypothetical protein
MDEVNAPALSPFTGLSDIVNRKKEDLNAKPKKTKKKIKQDKQDEKKKQQEDAALDEIVDAYVVPKTKRQPIPTKPKRKRKPPKKHVGTMALQVDTEMVEEPKNKRQRPAPPAKSEEDRRTIALLTSYGKNSWLGPYLKDSHSFDLSPQKLRKLKGNKLEELLADVEAVLSNKSNSALGDGVVRQFMYQAEAIIDHKTRFKVDGTTEKCFENDHWRFLLERVKMKYGVGFGKMDPISELTLVTFQTASLMHYNNAMCTPQTDLEEKITLEVV